jgi:hypothetical protein
MKVYPGTTRQTVRIFDELPEKLNNKPTVKAHTDGSQGRNGIRPVLVALRSFRVDGGH